MNKFNAVMSNNESTADVETETRSVENELLSRVREDSWNRGRLIKSVTADLNNQEVIVELGLERLLAKGELYQVDTDDGPEVRKT